MDGDEAPVAARAIQEPGNGPCLARNLPKIEVRGVEARVAVRQGRQELNGQPEPLDGRAKLRAVGAVPGDDRVEAERSPRSAWRRLHVREPDQVQAGRGNGSALSAKRASGRFRDAAQTSV